MTDDQLERLRIASHQKRRSGIPIWFIFFVVIAISAGVVFYAVPRDSDNDRSGLKSGMKTSREDAVAKADKSLAERNRAALGAASGTNTAAGAKSGSGLVDGSVLTVSGYIIAHERIEISPRFMGVVKWIGVKKGDSVTNGQTVVLLDDAEYNARLAENDGMLAVARVAVDRAKIDLQRAEDLVRSKVEMQKFLDDAQLALRSAEAQVTQILGARKTIETWLEWCVIKSPVNGVVLEKMVDPSELVTPQTFGGTRGPSTSLVAVADLNDLQVEIDVDESKLAKVSLGQRCKIAPVSYPDKHYDGVVVEIAPEANRSKGTVQIKVQIEKPDQFLTPELSATVDFIGKQG
jgi:HlyD family secretion protein